MSLFDVLFTILQAALLMHATMSGASTCPQHDCTICRPLDR